MASLGELFIELGVVGDVKPLEKALSTMKKATREMELQYNAAKRLAKYLDDIKKAQTEKEKADIKKRFEIAVRKDNEFKLAQKIEKQKEFANGIAGVAKGIGIFVGAVTAAAVAVNKFTNDLVSSNQEMLNLTRTTDTALSTFQKWNGIGKMLGVENAAQQLESLNERLFELQLTGEGARGFQLAGINPLGQNAEGVLEQLRGRVAGLSDTAATYLLKQMGLDPRMLHLLRMSRSEFEALGETVRKYQLNDDQRSEIQALNVQLQITAQKLQYLKDRAVLAIMPAWTRFMASLARVTEGLQKAVNWLTSTENGVKTLAGAIVVTLIPAVRLLFATLTAHPVVAAITAIVGALYLLIDDIVTYFSGGESTLGLLLGFFDDIDSKLNASDSPQWLKDLIALIANADKLDKLANTISKIKNGENVNVSTLDAYKNIMKYFLTATSLANPVYMTGKTQEWSDFLSANFVTPQMLRNTSDNRVSYTYDQRQINMTNSIQTNQPAYNIENELLFARNAMGSAFA